MKNHHNSQPYKDPGNMLNQKTFEDFNNIEPNPNDPDFKEPKQIIALPFVIDDGEESTDDITKDKTKGTDKTEYQIRYNYKETSDEYNYLRD